MTFHIAQYRPIRHLSFYEIGRTVDLIDCGRTFTGITIAALASDSERTLAGELISSEVTIDDDRGSRIILSGDAQWRLTPRGGDTDGGHDHRGGG